VNKDNQFNPLEIVIIPIVGGFFVGLFLVVVVKGICGIDVDDMWLILPAMVLASIVCWILRLVEVKREDKNEPELYK